MKITYKHSRDLSKDSLGWARPKPSGGVSVLSQAGVQGSKAGCHPSSRADILNQTLIMTNKWRLFSSQNDDWQIQWEHQGLREGTWKSEWGDCQRGSEILLLFVSFSPALPGMSYDLRLQGSTDPLWRRTLSTCETFFNALTSLLLPKSLRYEVK